MVLYNLNNINITERQRELATLKVLGFYDGEVASYVYRENIVLTLFGIIAGMGIGNFFAPLCDSDSGSGYDDVWTKCIFQKLFLQRTHYPGICIVCKWNDVLPTAKKLT